MQLKDKVVFITGAGSGIGKATAILFAQQGAMVVVAGRTISAGQPTVDHIIAQGGVAIAVGCDVTSQVEVNSAVEVVMQLWGRVDILVNGAGVGLTKSLEQTTEQEWDTVMGVNVGSIFHTGKAIIDIMKSQGGGVIVNIASNLALVAAPQYAAYCASKGAVLNLTRAMALDYAADNIRVNCICPGPVDTPMLLSEFPSREAMLEFGKTHPIGRISSPMEQAQTILFLASDASSYITGTSIVTDGGFTAG